MKLIANVVNTFIMLKKIIDRFATELMKVIEACCRVSNSEFRCKGNTINC